MPEVRDYAQNVLQTWSNSLAGGPVVQRRMIEAQVAQEDMEWVRKERAAALAQANAQAQWSAWQLRRLTQGPTPIADAAEGRSMSPGMRAGVDPLTAQAVDEAIRVARQQNPDDAMAVAAYLGTLVKNEGAKRAYQTASGMLQEELAKGEEAALPPESVQAMLADLDDATNSLSPGAVIELIRQQRQARADEMAAFGFMERTYGRMQAKIQKMDTEERPAHISSKEWDARIGQAMRAAERYRQFWREIPAAKAAQEIDSILYGPSAGEGGIDPREILQQAQEQALDLIKANAVVIQGPDDYAALVQKLAGNTMRMLQEMTGGMAGSGQTATMGGSEAAPLGTRSTDEVKEDERTDFYKAISEANGEDEWAQVFERFDVDPQSWTDRDEAALKQLRSEKTPQNGKVSVAWARRRLELMGFRGKFPSDEARAWLRQAAATGMVGENFDQPIKPITRRALERIMDLLGMEAPPSPEPEAEQSAEFRPQPDWPMAVP